MDINTNASTQMPPFVANVIPSRLEFLFQKDQDILEGITRASVIELARSCGINIIERPVDKTELFISDEVFLTGTAAKITPIKMIETTSMSKDMPIMNSLRKKLTKITEGLVPEYENWVKRVQID